MNNQNNSQQNEPTHCSKCIWKIIVAVVIAALVAGGGVYIWQGSSPRDAKKDSEKEIYLPQDETKEITESDKNTECGKLVEFKNESWAKNLEALYKNEFLKPQDLNGELWSDASRPTMAGDMSSCKINNFFVFIPEFFEFGCGKIFKYDIDKNILKRPKEFFCASNFRNVNQDYVEFVGGQGDGGQYKEYNGKYYYNENRIEL